jgi:hypothetical protein
MATKKSKATEAVLEPVVTKGSHLTVTKYPDGRTELVWDDEALMRDVQEAIASVQPKTETKPKAVKAKKAEPKKVKAETPAKKTTKKKTK